MNIKKDLTFCLTILNIQYLLTEVIYYENQNNKKDDKTIKEINKANGVFKNRNPGCKD